jgi:hypothetical protein
MAKVITTGSIIQCAHKGTVTFTPSQQKLMIDGQAALVTTDVSSATVSGCTTPDDPITGRKQCLKVTGLLAGAATKLGVNNISVLLETANGTTDGLDPKYGTWNVVSAGQTKLDAI